MEKVLNQVNALDINADSSGNPNTSAHDEGGEDHDNGGDDGWTVVGAKVKKKRR